MPLRLSKALVVLWLSLLTATFGLPNEVWKTLEPDFPVIGIPGEEVLIRVQGPPAQTPVLTLGDQQQTLVETEPGLYSTLLKLPTSHQRLLLQSTSKITLGQVEVSDQERYFEAIKETVTRQGPNPVYDRLTPVQPKTKIRINGSRGLWYRSAASGAWIDGQGSPPPQLGYLPPNSLNRVQVTEDTNGDALIHLECTYTPEIQVVESVATKTLLVNLSGCYQTAFDLTRATGVSPFVGPVLLRPQTQPLGVNLEIAMSRLCGFNWEQSKPNVATLRLRKPLPASLEGLKIAIDAGHGGPKDPGTVGHGGLAEKTLNLRVALALAQKLEALGADVMLTRTDDQDVASLENWDSGELQARIDKSIRLGNQLFLSLHHNARPSVEEGKISHGTDIYWFQPHSQPLAQFLADPIADAIGETSRTERWRSFHVIRQTHSPSVLIEFQYLSNPLLEASVLTQEDYPEKAANGVVEGLLRYLEAQP